MQRSAALPLLLGMLSAPAWAGDAQLQLGVDVRMNYEDNVFGNAVDEEGDFYLSASPILHAYDERGEFRWKLDYTPTYLKYHEFDQLDDWEHIAFAELAWEPTLRTRVFGNAEYIDASSFLRLSAVDPELGDAGVDLTTQSVERNTFTAGIEHRLTPRNAAVVQFSRMENDYELASRQDVTVLDASLQWIYDFSRQDRTGLELRWSSQEFGFPGAITQTTNYYNLSAIWQHTFDPTLRLDISVGPALVEPDDMSDFEVTIRRFPIIVGRNGVVGPAVAATCPVTPEGQPFLSPLCLAFPIAAPSDDTVKIGVIGDFPDGGGDDLTYFAAVSLTKQWKHVSASLRYTRDTSTSTDFSGGSVRDFVVGRIDWRVTYRFRTELQASYQRFEAATETIGFVTQLRPSPILGEAVGLVPFLTPNEREDQIYWARIGFAYDFTPRTTMALSVIWQTQITEIPPELPIKVDHLIVMLGVTYKFRAFPIGI